MVLVAIVGAGQLGGSIAGDLAYNGHTVRIWDPDPAALDVMDKRLLADKEDLSSDDLMVHQDFLGSVLCFGKLQDAVTSKVDMVIEAGPEELEKKQKLFERVAKLARSDAVLCTSTLRLPLDLVFQFVTGKERCIGMRHLYPVYCIPEVELNPSKDTAISTVEFCLSFLERIGKTGYFRSGPDPLILSESERDQRRVERRRASALNAGLGGRRSHYLVPHLAHAGNFAPQPDDVTASRPSALESECVICMDEKRSCVLQPCHHLCTCTDCGQMLVGRKDSCPICRTVITSVVKFFRS